MSAHYRIIVCSDVGAPSHVAQPTLTARALSLGYRLDTALTQRQRGIQVTRLGIEQWLRLLRKLPRAVVCVSLSFASELSFC